MTNASVAMHTTRTRDESSTGWTRHIRNLLVGILVGLACVALGAYVVVHWAERQIFTTDNWVSLVSPLPKNPVVSSSLGGYISNQIFEAVPVEQKIADALPPRAAFLAPPLTDQLKTLTTASAKKLVAGDAFQTLWSGANRAAMNRLLATARGQETPLQSKINEKFNLNLSDVSGGLRNALGSASSAIPALQPAANKAINISADLKARPHRLRQVVRTADTLAVLLPLLIATCFLSALALSSHRRHTALVAAITVIITMLVELVVIKWLRQETLNQVKDPANLSAISYIYDSLVGWLRHMILWVIAGATVCAGGLLLGGPAHWAAAFRQQVRLDRLQASHFMARWREVRLWTQQWKYYLWLGTAVLVIISLATFVSVNGRTALNALLMTVSLCALVHIIASPPDRRRERSVA